MTETVAREPPPPPLPPPLTAPPPLPPRDPEVQDVLRSRIDALDGVEQAATLAMRFAALSGKFDPRDALLAAGIGISEDISSPAALLKRIAVTAQVSQASDTRVWKPCWIMRAAPRGRLLADARAELGALVAWREGLPGLDDTARNLCDALLGRNAFADAAITRLLADPQPDRTLLESVLRGLTLAEPAGPGGAHIPGVRAALARASSMTVDPLLANGVVGRDDEIAWLNDGIARQWAPPEAPDTPALPPDIRYLGGIGGIGKSTLLAEVARVAVAEHDALVVTFDFDRPGIEGGDPLGLSLDLARQVVATAGAEAASLYADRLRNSGGATAFSDSARSEAQSLIGNVADTVTASGRPLLLLLDTLESLALRGDSAANELINWLRVVRAALPHVAIVAAGRGEPHVAIAKEVSARMLTGLPPAMARALLARLGVPDAAAERLAELANGNPLVLRLGARLVKEAGADALQDDGLAPGVSDSLLSAQLYRLILSRIADPVARSIAHPGLLLRRIDADTIRTVIWPEIAPVPIDDARATVLLGQLERYAWLVRVEGGWLVHRPELRAILLAPQIAADPERAKRMFRRAADGFATGRRADAREALYYRLMLTRWGGRTPRVDAATAAQFTSDMIADLPRPAQDALALASGARSSRLRASESAPTETTPVRHVMTQADADEIATLVERSDFAEAATMIGRAGDVSALDPRSPATDGVIRALWHLGDVRAAAGLLQARDAAQRDAGQTASVLPESPILARGVLAVRAELDPDAFRARARVDPPWREQAAEAVSRAALEIPDLDVAALLLRAEGETSRSAFADHLWTLWADEPPSQDDLHAILASPLAAIARKRRAAAFGLEDADPADPIHACVCLLSANAVQAAMISDKLTAAPPLGGQAALDALSAAVSKALLPTLDAAVQARFAGPYAAEQFNAIGTLAEWATLVTAALPGAGPNAGPGGGTSAMARGARRRSSTIAGYWSYGAPPPGWRQPRTDLRTLQRLTALLAATDTAAAVEAALAELATDPAHRWSLQQRLDAIVAATPVTLVGNRAAAAADTAQRLIEHGAPLLLAPALAMRLTDPHHQGITS